MFERLAGKILSRFLSKYFVQGGTEDGGPERGEDGYYCNNDSSSSSSSSSSSPAGYGSSTDIWSGYVSLENLRLRNDVVNDLLKAKGLPFELVSCTVGRVEITVPWAKLGLRGGRAGGPSSSSSYFYSSERSNGANDSAAATAAAAASDGFAVVVVDGVYVLLRTTYDFDDDALEKDRVSKRRKQLELSNAFVKPKGGTGEGDGGAGKCAKDDAAATQTSSSSSSSSLAGFFQRRLTEGIAHDIFERLHVHVRDVHIRLEDAESDPSRPVACGLTLESLHAQADEEREEEGGGRGDAAAAVSSSSSSSCSSSSGVPLGPGQSAGFGAVRKVVRINHCAAYWNNLRYSCGLGGLSGLGGMSVGIAGVVPAELSVMHLDLAGDRAALLRAMSGCIARRALLRGGGAVGVVVAPPTSLSSSAVGAAGVALQDVDAAAAASRPALLYHSYLLLPVDGYCRARLSRTPRDLSAGGPALVLHMRIRSVLVELRDFQYSRMLDLGASIGCHDRARRYRRFRPRVSPKVDPRAWWTYAARVITVELREGRIRWSWTRFHARSDLRRRYCHLYERFLLYGGGGGDVVAVGRGAGLQGQQLVPSITSSLLGLSSARSSGAPGVAVVDTRPIDGDGGRKTVGDAAVAAAVSGTHADEKKMDEKDGVEKLGQEDEVLLGEGPGVAYGPAFAFSPAPLSQDELKEMRDVEDGLRGNFSVHDVVIFRAIVHARIAGGEKRGTVAGSGKKQASQTTKTTASLSSSGVLGYIRGMIQDDSDAQEEYERLLAFVASGEAAKARAKAEEKEKAEVSRAKFANVAVFLDARIERGSVSLFAPRRASFVGVGAPLVSQRLFLDLSYRTFAARYTLLGNYDSFEVDVSIHDVDGEEVRSDGSRHSLLVRHESPCASDRTEKDGLHCAPTPVKGPKPGALLYAGPTMSGKSGASAVARPATIVSFQFVWKPLDCEQSDIILAATVKKCQLVLKPDCEWLGLAKSLLTTQSYAPNTSEFWENMSMAYINSWESAKAGLQAKAELVLFKHKNIDLRVTVDCPMISIHDNKGARLDIDLGQAQFVTQSIVGTSRSSAMEFNTDSWDMGVDGMSKGGFVSSFPFPRKFSLARSSSRDTDDFPSFGLTSGKGKGATEPSDTSIRGDNASSASSAGSVDGKRVHFNDSRSLTRDEGRLMSVTETSARGRIQKRQNSKMVHACFYDSFHLSVQSITISIFESDERGSVKVLHDLDLSVRLDKSVIPADHTISRIKADWALDNMRFRLTRRNIALLGGIATSWVERPSQVGTLDEIQRGGHVDLHKHGMTIGSVINSGWRGKADDDSLESQSDASSEIDEDEFLDALDTEMAEDDVAEWFEENWIVDAESASVYDTSARAGERTKSVARRRLPSISDVSSLSSRSVRKSRRVHVIQNAYLSAENLARLDETGGEDQSRSSAGEDDTGDDDSFHSAMSVGGQQDLADTIQKDIILGEEEIEKMKGEVRIVNQEYLGKLQNGMLSESDKKAHRTRKNDMKIELMRSEAELKALKAAYQDLMVQLAAAKQFEYEKKLNPFSQSFQDSSGFSADDGQVDLQSLATSARSAAARRANALLKARTIRSAQKQHLDTHNLMRHLNRDLVLGSISIGCIYVELADDDTNESAPESVLLSLVLEGLSLTLHQRSFDVRVYFTLEFLSLSDNITRASGGQLPPFLSGGGSDDSYAFATQYPHLVSSNFVQDRFVRFALEFRRRPRKAADDGHARRSIKVKLSMGVIELHPEISQLASCVSFVQHAKDNFVFSPRASGAPRVQQPSGSGSLCDKVMKLVMGNSETVDYGSDEQKQTGFRSEVTFHLGMFNVGVSGHRREAVGGLCITGLGARHSCSASSQVYSTRGQADVQVKNIQLLDLQHAETASARELVGRRDIYQPLVQVRVRVQLVPVDDTGGWVVDSKDIKPTEKRGSDEVAWNMHVGVKSQSLSVTATSSPLMPIIKGVDHLIAVVQNSGCGQRRPSNSVGSREVTTSPVVSLGLENPRPRIPLRWRIDFALNKISTTLPCGEIPEGLGFDRGRSMCATFSVSICLQEDRECLDTLISDSCIKDVRVFRAFDNWNILEPTAFHFSTELPSSVLGISSSQDDDSKRKRLCLPQSSPWSSSMSFPGAEDTGMNRTFNGEDRLTVASSNVPVSVSVSALPIRVNLSVNTCCLLLDIIDELKSGLSNKSNSFDRERHEQKIDEKTCAPQDEVKNSLIIQSVRLAVPSVVIKLYQEIKVPVGIPHKNATALLSMRNMIIGYSHDGESRSASLDINELSVFDLSCHPGISVFGPSRSHILEGTEEKSISLSISIAESLGLGPVLVVELCLGPTQCILIPALMKLLLDVVSETRESLQRDNTLPDVVRAQNEIDGRGIVLSNLSFPFQARCLRFSVKATGFDLILSSRELPTYIEAKDYEPISVISTRWSSELIGVVSICGESGSSGESVFTAGWLNSMIIESGADIEAAEAWNMLLRHFDEKDNTGQGTHKLSKIVAMKSMYTLKDVQILRTCIRRVSREEAKAFNLDPSVCCFLLSPPTAGEQQILSPVGLKLAHTLTASSLHSVGNRLTFDNLSQAVQVDINFIDILLYIRQSAGGMNEALKVTVLPFLRMLGRKRRASISEVAVPQKAAPVPSDGLFEVDGSGASPVNESLSPPEQSNSQRTTSAMDLARTSVLVASIRAAGIQVTCVPGGATRLTENPIMKCAVHGFRSGFAMTPVPEASNPLLPAFLPIFTLDQTSGEKNTSALSELYNVSLLAAGWMEFSISAHYHNRRLVAWEPVIEPWTCLTRFGFDVTQALGWAPTQWFDASLVEQTSTDERPSLSALIQESLYDRRFGRLLRFSSANSRDHATTTEVAIGSLQYSSQISHLLLYLLQAECLHLALLCKETSSPAEKDAIRLDFASGRQIDWLLSHGHPQPITNSKSDESRPLVSISISDKKPLNVNVSGALLENIELISNELGDGSKRNNLLAPHRIRNETGVQIKFYEILNSERLKRGESSTIVVLDSGREIPLSLKRDISQSCNPHRACISLEIGHFHDADSGKDGWNPLLRPRYKAIGRVPVDNVGVYQFNCSAQDVEQGSDLYLDGEDAIVIVRIALNAQGTKVVSVESPLFLRNATTDLLRCEITHKETGLQLWSATLPAKFANESADAPNDFICTPVPTQLVPMADAGSVSFFVGIETIGHGGQDLLQRTRVPLPPPFSKKSASRGLIAQSEVAVKVRGKPSKHLNACSLRIGNFDSRTAPAMASDSSSPVFIPQQRMVMFRPPVMIKNHLPFSIIAEVRKKSNQPGLHRSVSNDSGRLEESEESEESGTISHGNWANVGTIACGENSNWLGARSVERVELRVKIASDTRGGGHFPYWSAPVVIDSETYLSSRAQPNERLISKMSVKDVGGTAMDLSVALMWQASNISDNSSTLQDNILLLSDSVSASPRVASVYVPYWIVDNTGLNLEYATESPLAGQIPNVDAAALNTQDQCDDEQSSRMISQKEEEKSTSPQGLVDLLNDDEFFNLEVRNSYEVHMIGDSKAYRLTARPVVQREGSNTVKPYRWSESITLHKTGKQQITVRPPRRIPWLISSENERQALALQAHVVAAPESFGGHLGTKLVHVVNRYLLINSLDRDIEVMPTRGSKSPVLITHRGSPFPFHFDDSASIRFRPTELGWGWSGPFMLKKDRREVVLRLRNRLTGNIIIAAVELDERQNEPVTVVFRAASCPPFRLENHSLRPLQFGQSCYLIDRIKGTSAVGDVTYLLPYHNANFAWDEPDETMRTVFIEVADFGLKQNLERRLLGVFRLDVLAPGSSLRLGSSDFFADIVADGPTRVLRISDSSLPRLSCDTGERSNSMLDDPGASKQVLEIKLLHGIGLSVVDWTPQELVYLRMQNVMIERRVALGIEDVTVSIGSISADNQLWVTPYPVLLKVGAYSQDMAMVRRRRKGKALNLSWSRELRTFGALDGLSLFRSVAVSMDQLNIRIDGRLVRLIRGMITDAAEMRHEGAAIIVSGLDSRDSELMRALGNDMQLFESPRKNERRRARPSPKKQTKEARFFDDTALTAAAAAKTSHRVLPSQHFIASSQNNASLSLPTFEVLPRKSRDISEDVQVPTRRPRPTMTKPRRKYYIEKIRISSVKTDISWAGMLPLRLLSLPDFLRPKLAFEGLPILLRPYSDAHLYGSLEEHLQRLKSHYINIWRVLDLLVGLAFKPTFLVRACLYTGEQTAASAFDTLSEMCSFIGNEIQAWSPEKVNISPYVWDDKRSELVVQPKGYGQGTKPYFGVVLFCGDMIGKVMYATSSFFHGAAHMNAMVASSLRYTGSSHMLKDGESTEAARLRAPRLFANQDGKDLLVEYVEGDNAGKALLSRVSTGIYLGEGCIFHGEGARLITRNGKKSSDALIFILTTARLLLLRTSQNLNICSIRWEVGFDQIVSLGIAGSTIECWYLSKEVGADGKKKEGSLGSTEKSSGLGDIRSKSVYFPGSSGETLLKEVSHFVAI